MDSLQIQDSFAPYFNAASSASAGRQETESARNARPAHRAELVERLKRCRDALAHSLPQTDKRA